MLTVRTSENTVITSFRLISERQDFSSVRTAENTVRARARIQINDSFLSISLRNKTFNGVPEHVYIGDSERNALSLQYAKAYLRYVKPGTVLGRVVQFQLIA